MNIIDNIERLMKAKGMTAAQVAKNAGKDPSSIYKLRDFPNQEPRRSTIEWIAKGLGVTVAEIISGTTIHSEPESNCRALGVVESVQRLSDSACINRWAECMAGDMDDYASDDFSSDPLDQVSVPDSLLSTRGLVALLVQGDSMLGAANSGATVFATAALPPIPNTQVVVALKNGARYIKIYEGSTASTIKLRQLNPPRSFNIPRDHVAGIFRVIETRHTR